MRCAALIKSVMSSLRCRSLFHENEVKDWDSLNCVVFPFLSSCIYLPLWLIVSRGYKYLYLKFLGDAALWKVEEVEQKVYSRRRFTLFSMINVSAEVFSNMRSQGSNSDTGSPSPFLLLRPQFVMVSLIGFGDADQKHLLEIR